MLLTIALVFFFLNCNLSAGYMLNALNAPSTSKNVFYFARYASIKPVDVSFEPSGKKIVAEQGEVIEAVAKRAGVIIPFKCKQGRCNSCEVRLNGRGKLGNSSTILSK